jgi:hypothetical protein
MGTSTLDKAGCGCDETSTTSGASMLPADPFTALQYHFGMLLGVDDLETGQAYPRGKIRLHNAWLHREGAVWGLNVSFNERKELAVAPGLALDAAGHELHLDATACVDLGKWYDKHKADVDFKFTDDGRGGVAFDAHVVARFRACLARPVPAIADPCEGSETDVAFSRVSETIELCLRPGLAPRKDRAYHRLRILFALEDDSADYAEVKTRREAILALPPEQQPRGYLKAFREFAALDEIDLTAQQDATGTRNSLFPEEPTEVVLANVRRIRIRQAEPASALEAPLPIIDVRVRPAHVATATIQELLCGPLFAGVAGGGPVEGPAAPASPGAPDGGGPRIDAATVKTSGKRRITLTVDRQLSPTSVRAEQFSVTTYATDTGWSTLDIKAANVDSNTLVDITIELKESMTADQLVRLIARGTGPQPILGADLVPLAGRVGGPPGSTDDGNDFVIMLRS